MALYWQIVMNELYWWCQSLLLFIYRSFLSLKKLLKNITLYFKSTNKFIEAPACYLKLLTSELLDFEFKLQ